MISVLRIKKEDGTWENIPAIKGEKGDKGDTGADGAKGEQGVYVGETEPTDNSLIWLNPNGEAATGIATEAYVDTAIEAAIGGAINGSY